MRCSAWSKVTCSGCKTATTTPTAPCATRNCLGTPASGWRVTVSAPSGAGLARRSLRLPPFILNGLLRHISRPVPLDVPGPVRQEPARHHGPRRVHLPRLQGLHISAGKARVPGSGRAEKGPVGGELGQGRSGLAPPGRWLRKTTGSAADGIGNFIGRRSAPTAVGAQAGPRRPIERHDDGWHRPGQHLLVQDPRRFGYPVGQLFLVRFDFFELTSDRNASSALYAVQEVQT